MTNFKVGDRIRKASGDKFGGGLTSNDYPSETTVSRITHRGHVVAEFNGLSYLDRELELVPTSKFKIGDKVRLLNGSLFIATRSKEATIYATDADSSVPRYMMFDNNLWYGAHELELVPEPKTPEYSVGDTVVLKRSGTVVRLTRVSRYETEVITPGLDIPVRTGASMIISARDIEAKYDAEAAKIKRVAEAKAEYEAAFEKAQEALNKLDLARNS